MLMVWADQVQVERDLFGGRLSCPDCSALLRPWGWARWRVWRLGGGDWRARPRRGRCTGCQVTHVVLPVSVLCRRADGVDVIGAALLAKATGAGHRVVAEIVGRALSTVRGWLRRFKARAEAVQALFTRLLYEFDPAPDPVVATGSMFVDAVEVLGRSASAASRMVGPIDPWQFACAATGGLLLAPLTQGVQIVTQPLLDQHELTLDTGRHGPHSA